MQVKRSDQEIVYLTEIKDLSPGSGLPKPASLIGHLFTLALACSHMAASAAWITPPKARDGVVYGGRQAASFRGPDGALMDVVAL